MPLSSKKKRFLLSVRFEVEPVVLEVEGESLEDVWQRRYELAAGASPDAWEVHPSSVEAP